MSSVIQDIERSQLRKGLPSFDAGDRVRVHFQVVEGNRRRTQVFEGIVLRRQGSGVRETFTVRKQSFGVGVERTFPLHSPKIEKLEIAARGDVRRAKLYYLRGRIGKAARVAERRWGIDEELISTPTAAAEPEAVDAEGVSQTEEERGGSGAISPRAVRLMPPRRLSLRLQVRRLSRHGRCGARGGGDRGQRRGAGCRGRGAGQRARRLRRRPGLKLSIPKPKTRGGGFVELVVIVALALGLALAIQAWLIKPYQIPSQSMEPTLDVGQRVLVNRFLYHFTDPGIGDIVVFHPPAGADQRSRMRRPARAEGSLPAPDRRRVEPELHQADRRRARRHARRPQRAPGRQRRREDRRALHTARRPRAPSAICRKRSRFHPTTTS